MVSGLRVEGFRVEGGGFPFRAWCLRFVNAACQALLGDGSDPQNPQPSTLSPQPSTLNPQPSTLNLQP